MRQLEQFSQLLIALNGYDSHVGALPDSDQQNARGESLYSWRLSLMGFVQAVKDSIDYEQSWTAEWHRGWLRTRPAVYFSGRRSPKRGDYVGSVSVVIGPGTPFQEQGSMQLENVPCDTILIIEAQGFSKHWMAPGDLRLYELNESLLDGTDGDGVMVGFADGEIWLISPEVPLTTLKKYFVATDHPPRDRNKELLPFRLSSDRVEMTACTGSTGTEKKEGR